MLPEGFEDVAPDLAAAALGLARRFAEGATMWVVAPRWPAHGRHVAVEFVHPVIVGKRALPTVHVDDADAVGAVRLLARPGDVVLAVGPADDPSIGGVLRRADAWGLTTLWVGSGPRPDAGAADHVLWVDGAAPPGVLERSGAFVLLYHVLWELTHVVFEHPGLLAPPAPDTCEDDACITCSDEGQVAEVASVGPEDTAVVRTAGRQETIDITLVAPVSPGDLLLVHAGTAISVIEAAAAPGRPAGDATRTATAGNGVGETGTATDKPTTDATGTRTGETGTATASGGSREVGARSAEAGGQGDVADREAQW